jgi:2-oxoglutarate dehydrogenase E2 component (dihydrolipoamide succinyltransferase)
MATNVIMPQLGESVVEGTVSKWLKREGEAVKEYDPLMEVNTDKVDTEIPAPASGTLLKVYVAEGTTVSAGTLLAVIGQPGEALPAAGNGAGHAPAQQAPIAPAGAVPPAGAVAASASAPKRDLGFISPVVAKLADEYHLDLQQIMGSGRGGRITKKDVLAYLEQPPAAGQPAAALPAPAAPADELPPWEKPGEGDLFRPTELQFAASDQAPSSAAPDSRPASSDQPLGLQPPSFPVSDRPAPDSIPVEGMRKLIAEHMVRSERTAPHVTTVFEADLSKVAAHLETNKDAFARDGATLTLTAYFVSAAVAALKALPIVNSQWTDERILLKRELNIGLAVALDEGLIVPVLRRADEKSLLGLAREINDLARRARGRALRADEVQGGTFTITNHGVSGSLLATPIINQPQTAILGVGVMQKRVVVINDAIAIRPMVYLTLTFDHRVLDGAVADRFMSVVKTTLENWR